MRTRARADRDARPQAEEHRRQAVSTIHDFTQIREPLTQRTFFSDFRTVDGLVLPHRLDMEFGARLEEMVVESIRVDAPLETTVFTFEPPAGEEETAPEEGG